MFTIKKNLSLEQSLFRDFYPIILFRSVQIVQTPEFYNCKPEFVKMSDSVGGPNLTLGDLCVLWGNGKFIAQCSICGGYVLILSGSSSGKLIGGESDRTGYCIECLQFLYEEGAKGRCSVYLNPMLYVYFDFIENKKFKVYDGVKGLDFSEVIEKLVD